METVEITRLTFEAIGTRWDIQIPEPVPSSKWAMLQRQIQTRIGEFDKAYSRFRADSLVSQIARGAGTYALPADGYTLLALYEQLYRATDGKVTPLVGQALSDAGYDATYSMQTKAMQTPPKWEGILAYDLQKLTVKEPVLLDFGAAGKGYLVDIVAEQIEAAGISSYLINAGGDIRQRSARNQAVHVGLENPFDTTEAIGTLDLCNQSLCASSGSKRTWGTYHHIIDPKTLKSPVEIVATWVLAENTMLADGLATALFFVSPESLAKDFAFAYTVVTKDGQITRSKNFPVQLFT